jgi:FKBP-type peptidyl-prolyl cis-trans isomerase
MSDRTLTLPCALLALLSLAAAPVFAGDHADDHDHAAPAAEAEAAAEAAAEAPAADAPAADAPAEASAPVVEVSEEDLVGLIGYLSAQGAGIGMLQLDQPRLDALIESFNKALSGETSITEADPAIVQTAMSEARARIDAGESEEEGAELPEISVESSGVIGLIIVAQTGLTDFEFNPEEVALIREGFLQGLEDGEMSEEVQAMMPAFQEFMQVRVGEIQARMAAQAAASAADNKAAGAAFLEELKAGDAAVEVTESGLHYKVLEPGGEEQPGMSDSVLVHYRGTLIDGTQFDSSYDRGEPATFPLNGVVPGFGEGLTKVGEGGKIMLYIPSELGYGDNPRPGGAIKPGDTLVFECELLEINP